MKLSEIKELASKRTPGDWKPETGEYSDPGYCDFRYAKGPSINYRQSNKLGTPAYSEDTKLYDKQIAADAAFIAAMANSIDKLLAVCEAAKLNYSNCMLPNDCEHCAALMHALAALEQDE